MEKYKERSGNKAIIAVIVSSLLLISMLTTIPDADHFAKAQSTTGTTINSNLINDIYAASAGNDSRSFAATGSGPTTSNIMWTTSIQGVNSPSLSDITAFGGYVFVINATDTIALDGGTGNIVYTIPNTEPAQYIGGNYMLVGSNCYTVDTGTLVWKAPAGFSAGQLILNGGGALVTDPQHLPAPMFFSSGCGWELTNPAQQPTVLWNDTGKTQFTGEVGFLGTYFGSGGSVYGDGVIVSANTADQTFSGFNAATGTYLWTVYVPSTEFCGTTSINGVFAFGTEDGWIYAWNITTGQFMWKFNPGTPDSSWSWSLGSSYGMIYGHNQDTNFYAINATSGKEIWVASIPDNGVAYSGTFTIAGDYIYAQMGDNEYRNPYTGAFGHNEFECLNAYNGTEVWSLPIATGAPANAQCVAYGNLYVIPTTAASTSGVFTYSTNTLTAGGTGTLNEVMCIGSGTSQNWPMYMDDAAHDSSGVGPTSLTVLWSKPVGSGAAFASSPVFANGIGYIGSTNQNLYAFNSTNGDVIWNYTTGAPIYSTPAVADGNVYTGADDGNVYCLNAATGSLTWKVTLPAGPATNMGFGESGTEGPPSPIVVGNDLYIGDNDYIYCLNVDTGATIWSYTWGMFAPLIGTPTVVNNIVYIAPDTGYSGELAAIIPGAFCPDGFLYGLNAQTGKLVSNITIPYVENPFLAEGYTAISYNGEGIIAPVAVDTTDNLAFVQQMNERTDAINLTSGTILWTYDAYYNPGTPGQWGTEQNGGVLYSGGNVYFNEWYDIVCLNAISGNLTWNLYLNRESENPLTIYAGNLYDVTYTFVAYVINAATGTKESFAACGDEPTTPVPYAGDLYVASGDFNITCYTQAAPVSVTPVTTPTPMPTPTQTPSSTSGSTATPLSLSPLGYAILYVAIAIIIAIVVSVAAVGSLVLRTLKKQKL